MVSRRQVSLCAIEWSLESKGLFQIPAAHAAVVRAREPHRGRSRGRPRARLCPPRPIPDELWRAAARERLGEDELEHAHLLLHIFVRAAEQQGAAGGAVHPGEAQRRFGAPVGRRGGYRGGDRRRRQFRRPQRSCQGRVDPQPGEAEAPAQTPGQRRTKLLSKKLRRTRGEIL